MKTLDEIHDMIQMSEVSGDNGRLLDICQALLEQLRDVKRITDHLSQVENTREWVQGNPSY